MLLFPNNRRDVQGRILIALVAGDYDLPLCILRGKMRAYPNYVESYIQILSNVWKDDFCLPPSAGLFQWQPDGCYS